MQQCFLWKEVVFVLKDTIAKDPSQLKQRRALDKDFLMPRVPPQETTLRLVHLLTLTKGY